ncbi:MAG: hypothetical protein Q9183_007009 [Haloplaca sp. 2 TL-2023]
MDAALKIDEGYSEDTRSQDDTDSPMRMDAMGDGALSQTWSSAAGVPHQIMSLSEAERSASYELCGLLLLPRLLTVFDRYFTSIRSLCYPRRSLQKSSPT